MTSTSSHEYAVAPDANGCPPPLYFFANSLMTGPFERNRTRMASFYSMKITQATIPLTFPKEPTNKDVSDAVALNCSSISFVILM